MAQNLSKDVVARACLVYHGLGEERCEEHLGPLLLLLVRGHALVVDLRVPVGCNSFVVLAMYCATCI